MPTRRWILATSGAVLLAAGLPASAAAAPTHHDGTTAAWVTTNDKSGGLLLGYDASGKQTKKIQLAQQGSEPSALILDRAGKLGFVTDEQTNGWYTVDLAGGKVRAAALAPGDRGTGLALSPDEKSLYVATSYGEHLHVIDVASGSIRKTVTLPGPAEGVRVSPDGKLLYVGVYSRDQIDVLNAADGSTVAAIATGKGSAPRQLALTPDGKTLYAADYYGGDVAVVDTAKHAVARRIPGVARPWYLHLSPDGRTLYVSVNGGANGSVTALDTRSGKVTRSVPIAAKGMVWTSLSRDGRTLFATADTGGALYSIDTRNGKTTTLASIGLAEGVAAAH